MIVGSIARRYAKALFELAVEQGKVDAWSAALQSLKQAVEASAELRDVLENPIYTKDQRRAIVARLVSALRLEAEPANLLYLLGDRGRLAQLAAVVDEFGTLADAKLGRLRARVTSAVPLDPATATHIADRLARATRAQVILDAHVDPEILGGVVAQVGSLTYDGSVRTQLEDLRRSLKQ
jgi:F-type H+-transporting ATPase subunit delta